MRQIHEVQTRKPVRGLAGAVMCAIRHLGVRWPQWHTLIFGNDTKIDMIFVLSERGRKDAHTELDQCSGQQSTGLRS